MMKSCVLLFAMSLLTLAATMPTGEKDIPFADLLKNLQDAIAANMSCAELSNTIDKYSLKAKNGEVFVDLTEFIANFNKKCHSDDDSENLQENTERSRIEQDLDEIILASYLGLFFQIETLAEFEEFLEEFYDGPKNYAPTLTNKTSQPGSFGNFVVKVVENVTEMWTAVTNFFTSD